MFDREPREWQHFREADPEEPQDEIEENSTDETEAGDSALCAPGPEPVENPPLDPPCAPPQSAACTPNKEPSDSNHQSPESMEGRPFKQVRPQEFSSRARQIEQAKLQAAEEARKPQRIPIIEGSKPWEAHVKAGHPRTLVGTVEIDGKRHLGWYFEAAKCNGLYPIPKQSTGPPAVSPLMKPGEENDLKW
jgi:hypothetical protein